MMTQSTYNRNNDSFYQLEHSPPQQKCFSSTDNRTIINDHAANANNNVASCQQQSQSLTLARFLAPTSRSMGDLQLSNNYNNNGGNARFPSSTIYHPRHSALLRNRHRLRRFQSPVGRVDDTKMLITNRLDDGRQKNIGGIEAENDTSDSALCLVQSGRRNLASTGSVTTGPPSDVMTTSLDSGNLSSGSYNPRHHHGLLSSSYFSSDTTIHAYSYAPLKIDTTSSKQNLRPQLANKCEIVVYGRLRKKEDSLSADEDYSSLVTSILSPVNLLLGSSNPPGSLEVIFTRPPAPQRSKETKMLTSVYELKDKGLEETLGDLDCEMNHWIDYPSTTKLVSATKDSTKPRYIAICLELIWSVPEKLRHVGIETTLKNRFGHFLRHNNNCVWDEVDRINNLDHSFIPGGGNFAPEMSQDEIYGHDMECFTGLYRRYYRGFMPLTHEDTQVTHEKFWKFDPERSLEEPVDWPLIGSPSSTSVIMLNMILLRL